VLLGDVLARLDDDAVAAETIMNLADISLIARLREHAEASGQSIGAYAAGAVRRYMAHADDEEWLALMGAIGRADDPAAVCLRRIFTLASRYDNEKRSASRTSFA
jgi:hypothetical protein